MKSKIKSFKFFFFCIAALIVQDSKALLIETAKNQNSFEENKGQIKGDEASKVDFVYRSNGVSMFLMGQKIVYQFNKIEYPKEFKSLNNSLDSMSKTKYKIETNRVDLILENSNPNAKVSKKEKSKSYCNYYNYNVIDVYQYDVITYHSIYPNIDLVFYKKENQIKYDFIVHPNGDPSLIKIKVLHSKDLKINKNGGLILSTKVGEVRELPPISYQGEDTVKTNFKLDENIFCFQVSDYDISRDLVIDPIVEWSTYYGGNYGDFGYDVSIDQNDNVYLTGRASSSSLNIIASGGHQVTYGDGQDAFLVKFNSSGNRLWGTYYGGIGWDEAKSIKVDNSGNIYMTGYTESSNNISFGGFQNVNGGDKDAFLVKFDSLGTRKWATFYGGSGAEIGYKLVLDSNNNIYVGGETSSLNGIALSGHQNSYGGGNTDSFLVKFDSLGARKWATYYGGAGPDKGEGLAIKNNHVYMSGRTASSNNIGYNGFRNVLLPNTSHDAFLVKFDLLGNRIWSTYYGGDEYDWSFGVQVDDNDNVYLGGQTNSINNIAFNGQQNFIGGVVDAFLVKFNSVGNRIWSTYLGGDNTDLPRDIAINNDNVLFIVGWTNSPNNIEYNTPYQDSITGEYDSFYLKVDTSGIVLYGTYFGGSNREYGEAISVKDKVIYVAGATESSDLFSINSHQNNFGNNRDAYLVKFNECLPDHSIDTHTACNSYTWIDGVTYTASNNTATHTLTNSIGCDSIVTLDLTIYNSTVGIDTHTACNSYTWIDGVTYTTSNNTGTFTLTNSIGCDSIVTLDLTIYNSTVGTDTHTACNSYTWIDGVTYTASNNIATYTLTNSLGCDSMVTLDLTIYNSTVGTDTHTACNSYTWIDGVTYTSSNNTAMYTLTSSLGCDSVVTLGLTIVNETNWSITYIDNTLYSPLGMQYQWFLNGSIIPNATDNNFKPNESGEYSVEVNMNDSCHYTFKYKIDSLDIFIKIFPNPVQNKLNIKSNVDFKYQLFDSKGRLIINNYMLKKHDEIDVSIYESGVYILILEGNKNVNIIKKIIIN